MTELRENFNNVLSELKERKYHGAFSYKVHNRWIQVSGWNFIYRCIERSVYKIHKTKGISYPLIVHYDYMKAHLDYLKQLDLPPKFSLPNSLNRYENYYSNNFYSRWFYHCDSDKMEKKLEEVVIHLKNMRKKIYYNEHIHKLHKLLRMRRRTRLSDNNLKLICEYL
jgi:hypothetical protein